MASGGRLEVLVFGAGAIGTYVGGSLAARGHAAVFVERPEVAAALEATGVTIRAADGASNPVPRKSFRVAASTRQALETGRFDVALVALKSYDIPLLIAELESCLPRDARMPFLCLSNGVDNEQALARAFGAGRVIAGTVTTAVGRRAAGDVTVEKLRGTGVEAGHPLSERLSRAMNDAGLNTRLYRNATDMKWSKLLTNLLGNATSAILDMPPGEIFARPDLYRLEIAQLREALSVMRASKIRVADLPCTPVRLLALGVRLPPTLSRPLLSRAVGAGRGGKMPSFHIDLHSGRGRSEVDALNGAVVRHGEKTGILAPVNRLLTDTLLALTAKAIPLDSYARHPERLLEAAGSATTS